MKFIAFSFFFYMVYFLLTEVFNMKCPVCGNAAHLSYQDYFWECDNCGWVYAVNPDPYNPEEYSEKEKEMFDQLTRSNKWFDSED